MSTEGSFAKAFPVPSLQNDKAASGSSRLQSDSMNRKIPLVDDEVAIRNVYQLYLENHGHLVISASSVSEALRVMQVDEIHLIIIDIFLDNDSGLDLLKGVIAARPRLPAILMSGVPEGDPLFKEALASGATGCFSKTLPLSALIAQIAQIFNCGDDLAPRRGRT